MAAGVELAIFKSKLDVCYTFESWRTYLAVAGAALARGPTLVQARLVSQASDLTSILVAMAVVGDMHTNFAGDHRVERDRGDD